MCTNVMEIITIATFTKWNKIQNKYKIYIKKNHSKQIPLPIQFCSRVNILLDIWVAYLNTGTKIYTISMSAEQNWYFDAVSIREGLLTSCKRHCVY